MIINLLVQWCLASLIVFFVIDVDLVVRYESNFYCMLYVFILMQEPILVYDALAFFNTT